MTDDLVAKLRDEDSYYRLQEKHWCIDAEELELQRLDAADRIEALEAMVTQLQVDRDAVTALMETPSASISEDTRIAMEHFARHRLAERERIVAFIREQRGNAETRLGECTHANTARHFAAASVTCQRLADAIERGEHEG